jgi:hypothetical protein
MASGITLHSLSFVPLLSDSSLHAVQRTACGVGWRPGEMHLRDKDRACMTRLDANQLCFQRSYIDHHAALR